MNINPYTGQTTSNNTVTTSVATSVKNFGVYTFIDENGNVTQIKKQDKIKLLRSPEILNQMEWIVIGVDDSTAMGTTDEEVTFAKYFPQQS